MSYLFWAESLKCPCRVELLRPVHKIGSYEHIENGLPTHEAVSLKQRMEIEHALFSSDTLIER